MTWSYLKDYVGKDIMHEKRFIVDGLTIAENSPKGSKYLLEYQGGVNALCNRINGLFHKFERLEKEIKKLKSEHQNTLNVLDDFMSMLNKLQCNPDDETLQLQARDMLTLMNVDVKIGDNE